MKYGQIPRWKAMVDVGTLQWKNAAFYSSHQNIARGTGVVTWRYVSFNRLHRDNRYNLNTLASEPVW